jgi:hypothetical protein
VSGFPNNIARDFDPDRAVAGAIVTTLCFDGKRRTR